MRRRPGLFAGRVVCFDRNFPGHDLITAILDAGGHVVARVKEGISLGFGRAGPRLAARRVPHDLAERPVREESGPAAGPRRRAQRDHARRGGQEQASETCTIITTLLDHEAAPADEVRDAYLTRWSAAETTFGEDKSTIAGAGNRTSGPVLRSGCPRLVIQEAWAWLAATQLVRASEAAALRSEHAAARALRRRNRAMVTADEESFTAARHHAIRSMTSTQVTATSTLEALAAAADSAARACLHTLNLPGRQRHSERAQKDRPAHADSAARGTARHTRRDTRAETMPLHQSETDIKASMERESYSTPEDPKHLKSLVLRYKAHEGPTAGNPAPVSRERGSFTGVLVTIEPSGPLGGQPR